MLAKTNNLTTPLLSKSNSQYRTLRIAFCGADTPPGIAANGKEEELQLRYTMS